MIREHKYLKYFGSWLHDPNLWHLNRRSVSAGVAAGMFWAMIPMPMQMFPASITAIFLRANLPLAVATVWLTNPITMPPVFYFNYLVGTWLLPENAPGTSTEFEISLEWITSSMNEIWQPLYLGSVVVGIVSAILSFAILRGLWRLNVINHLRKRQSARANRATNPSNVNGDINGQ